MRSAPKSLSERLEKLIGLCTYEQSVVSNSALHLAFYGAVAHASLTDAFILTQRNAALRRIETSTNPIARAFLAEHSSGRHWISVGISHLTTSRQHLGTPAVLARPNASGWTLEGTVPWVTAGSDSRALVVGASDATNPEIQSLFYLPTKDPRVRCGPGMDLLALKDSCTDEVFLDGVGVSADQLLHGPVRHVMAVSQSGGAGGLQTSALALGLASRAIDHILEQSAGRSSLGRFAEDFKQRWETLSGRLYQAAEAGQRIVDTAALRKDSNDLVLRTTQAALAIEKGAGFLASSEVARWAQEALFFLVWSCPQPIAEAHLCDLTQFNPQPLNSDPLNSHSSDAN
ncbi:MAG: acyl-CoA dehydrogenase [Planctomycetota bacterium]|nr:acyl-CoA dehydrogenase [Planctomycetota bacterium]